MSKHGFTLSQIAGNNLDYFKTACKTDGKFFVAVLRDGVDLPEYNRRTIDAVDRAVIVDDADKIVACIKDVRPGFGELFDHRKKQVSRDPHVYGRKDCDEDLDRARNLTRLSAALQGNQPITVEVGGHTHTLRAVDGGKEERAVREALLPQIRSERDKAMNRAFLFMDRQDRAEDKTKS